MTFAERVAEKVRRLSMPPGYNGILVGGLSSTPKHRATTWAEYDERKAAAWAKYYAGRRHHSKESSMNDEIAELTKRLNFEIRMVVALMPVITAAREWSAARRACMALSPVRPADYDRLAKAEADLQKVVDAAA